MPNNMPQNDQEKRQKDMPGQQNNPGKQDQNQNSQKAKGDSCGC